MKFNHAALAAVSLLLASTGGSAQTILTGVTLFHSDSGGSYLGDEGWDTAPFGGAFKVWLKSGGIAGSTFLNTGGGGASPSLSLVPGTYSIGLFAEPGGYAGYHGLNLFFDGSGDPGISALAPDHATFGAPTEIYANGSASTLGFTGNSGLQGSGSLIHEGGGMKVTLTEFFLTPPDLYSLDEVSAYSPTPSGAFDRVGLMTLEVTAVPEPTSLAVVAGLGLAGFAAWRQRRARR